MAKKRKKEEEQRPTQLYLYLGVAEISKDRLRHVYLPVGEDWRKKTYPLQRPNAYAEETRMYQKRFGHARPGAVIRIEHDPEDDGTVFHKSAEMIGSVTRETAASWQATSNAIRTAHDAKQLAKKDGARDLQMETLEPLRAAYRALRNRNQRAAFMARVSVYLTS